MPMPIIHLCVAKSLTETLCIRDKANFYLASIAPDALYRIPTYHDLDFDGMYERYTAAHLTENDFNVWRTNVVNFTSSNDENRDFYTGYGVHILTDTYWKEDVFSLFMKKCSEIGKSYEESRVIYYNDAEILDRDFYKSFDLKSDVWGYLASCSGFGIDGLVTAEEVHSWKENTLKLVEGREDTHNTINYFTYEIMSDFIKSTVVKISKLLKAGQ